MAVRDGILGENVSILPTREEWEASDEGKATILHHNLEESMERIARAIMDRKITTSIKYVEGGEGLMLRIHGEKYILRRTDLDMPE